MQTASFVLSIVAIVVSLLNSLRQWRLSRHSNSLRVVVDLFKEHRDDRLARARLLVATELSNYDLSEGLSGLPEEERQLVRDLIWFYDNLGALVVHDIVDIEPIAGYLGGSVVAVWEKMSPVIKVEREKRRSAGQQTPAAGRNTSRPSTTWSNTRRCTRRADDVNGQGSAKESPDDVPGLHIQVLKRRAVCVL